MTVYKNVRVLTETEAAYLAGLIDGEGTITLTKRNANSKRTVVVSIANTEAALLEYPLEIIGAGKITSKRILKLNHTPSFTYQISGRQALALIRQINRFLKSYKRERSELIIENYIRLTPRNGRYTADLLIERDCFVKKFFSLKPNENNSRGRVVF